MDNLIKAFCPILLNSANIFQAPTIYMQHYANWILAPSICLTNICPWSQGRLNGPVNGLSVNFMLWPHCQWAVSSLPSETLSQHLFFYLVSLEIIYMILRLITITPRQMWLYLSLAVSCNFSCFSKGFMPLAFTISTSIFPQFPVWS